MKIAPLSTINNSSYKANYSKSQSFQGYVNGKYYRDEVIYEAQKALKTPDWKNKLLARKRTIGESLATWHDREGSNDIAGRVLMGIFTLGLTEVTWGLAQVAMDASDNKNIDKMIKEVEDCMNDMVQTKEDKD